VGFALQTFFDDQPGRKADQLEAQIALAMAFHQCLQALARPLVEIWDNSGAQTCGSRRTDGV
jgi:hypothetical protein